MVGCESFDRAALPGHSARDSSTQIICSLYGAPRARLHSLAIILTLAIVSKTKVLSASTTIKRMGYTLVTL